MTTHTQRQYQTYLRSPRWRLLRWLRKWMDGNRCHYYHSDGSMCGSRKRLEVHHYNYQHRGGNFLGELMDCVTWCHDCHSEWHNSWND